MGNGSAVGLVLGSVVFLLLGTVTRVGSAEQEPPGRQLYLRYCSACHGPQAKGDGVASSFMRPSPPDLTLLAKKHGGEFPLDLVAKMIDGREMPRVHGDPWMPVWGTVLGEEQASADKPKAAVEGKVQGRILAIADYLRTIQAH
jgi:mono/diheme cytochrome c family protein